MMGQPTMSQRKQATVRQHDRAQCWAMIRDRRTFRVQDLRDVGFGYGLVKSFVRLLRVNGIIAMERKNTSGREPGVYTLVKDLGRRCPRFTRDGALDPKPTPHERIWAAIKPLRHGFTMPELLMLTRIRSKHTVRLYVRALRKAGYVEILEANWGAKLFRYRLKRTMDTGPEPPSVFDDGSVWDNNLGRLIWSPSAEADSEAEDAAEEIAA